MMAGFSPRLQMQTFRTDAITFAICKGAKKMIFPDKTGHINHSLGIVQGTPISIKIYNEIVIMQNGHAKSVLLMMQ